MKNAYLPSDQYDALVQSVLAAIEGERCPMTGKITADQIKMAISEADVWPVGIKDR